MKRIIIVHWSKSIGPEPILQYPPEKSFPTKELFLKIWAKHELNKANPLVEVYIEEENIQYISIFEEFEGEIYFLVFAFAYTKKNIDNIIRDYPETIAVLGKNLIELLNTNKITRAISEAFTTINTYTRLETEENFLNFFHDKVKHSILKILQNGVISKGDLIGTLRDEYGFSTMNLDLLLIPFIREQLIRTVHLPGIQESYFLMKDLSCSRMPPLSLPILQSEVEKSVLEDYKAKLMAFYANYNYSAEIENKNIISILMDKDVYSLLKTLRTSNLSVNDCLNILNNKEELFNELIENNLIYEAKGIVYLFSDFRIFKFTPFYIMQKLWRRFKEQNISYDQYITHLQLLTDDLGIKTSHTDYEIV
jgi:hypothetical protein